MGRPSAMTKLGHTRVRKVRTRGANMKYRALKLDSGNFAWGSENTTRKVRVMDVVYKSTNNELVRTKTLVKNTIVQIDATPFRQWYLKRYGAELGKKVKKESTGEEKKSGHVAAKLKHRLAAQRLDPAIEEQFNAGRLLGCISSRPGQTGRCDGYILEADELAFYKKKNRKEKKLNKLV
jgi:small subunit ribosomal protein S8e